MQQALDDMIGHEPVTGLWKKGERLVCVHALHACSLLETPD